jgi:hypothetical protein
LPNRCGDGVVGAVREPPFPFVHLDNNRVEPGGTECNLV